MQRHHFLGAVLVTLLLGVPGRGQVAPTVVIPPIPTSEAPQRKPFTIPPTAKPQDLLPIAPNFRLPSVLLSSDLNHVPEVGFAEPLSQTLEPEQARELVAQQIDKIHHANRQKPDAFVELLMSQRTDLRGLPFQMGAMCRMPKTHRNHFLDTAKNGRREVFVGQVLSGVSVLGTVPVLGPPIESAPVSRNESRPVVPLLLQNASVEPPDASDDDPEPNNVAAVAAHMQVGPIGEGKQKEDLVRQLTAILHPAATTALAKVVLFSPEPEVRLLALRSLRVRRDQDYQNVLLAGLRYPYGPVNQRAAEALVVLKRTDLVAELVNVLDEPDPRMPTQRTTNGQKHYEVRELVKINHHHNCLLCHAPATPKREPVSVSGVNMIATVPVPSAPLPTIGTYDSGTVPTHTAIRFDVTYLRQDFSLMLSVHDAEKWPEKQRFDFVVRTRQLTDKEAAAYHDLVAKQPKGTLPPNHRAAVFALRELTGRDTAPTAAAWRELLELPPRQTTR